MLSAIKNRFTSLLQLILVIIYIIFEELIWEGIAKPIYEFVHSLKILQKVEVKLHNVNATVILLIFVTLLAVVELAGIYSGVLFVSGQVLLGVSLYLSKIPITAFTFYFFKITEDKLMQFGWFKWLYDWIMRGIDWVKSCKAYIKMIEKLAIVKVSIKRKIQSLKQKYFTKNSFFMTKLKYLYRTIREVLVIK